MFRRIFFAGILAGCLAGVLISAVQAFTTTPIILHAEQYEGGADHAAVVPHLQHAAFAARPDHPAGPQLADDGGVHDRSAWAPQDGLERLAFTLLSNIVIGVGFALLLVACYALHGRQVDGRRGVLWGLAGFAVFTLAPAVGLPPEVPGLIAADLPARQLWWVFAAGGAALGLWLMVFGKTRVVAVAGVVVIALPHLVGAPQPAEIGGGVPAELAGHFAATSIAVGAVFWAMLGWLSGALYRRFEHQPA